MGRINQIFGGWGLRASTAVVATLALVASGLVFQSGVDVPGAWAAVSKTNLVLSYDATNTSSYPGSGTTITDLTGTGKNATLQGSASVGSSAFNFTAGANGTSYATINGDVKGFDAGLTVSFEGALGAYDSYERIISIGSVGVNANGLWNNGGDGFWVGRYWNTSELAIEGFNAGTSTGQCRTSGAAADATVARWTFIITSAKVCRVYKNGVELQVNNNGGANSYGTTLNVAMSSASHTVNYLGRSHWTGDGDLGGSIRWIKVYSSALSTSEISDETTGSVTFDANGGTGSMSAQSSTAAASLTANSFTRSGYTFSGWNTAANGTGTNWSNTATYSFSDDITLYAQWTLNAPTVTTAPTIAGTATAGQTLTATAGTYVSGTTPTTTSKWQRSTDSGATWSDIAGASASTYTLAAADVGAIVRYAQTVTNSAGSITSASAATSIVLSANSQTTTTGGSSAVTDLIAAVPNDSSVYNVTIIATSASGTLDTTRKLKWSSTPGTLTALRGEDKSGQTPGIVFNGTDGTWATAGYPVLSFQGTGSNIRTALGSLTYSSSSLGTDVLKIYVNTGSTTSWDAVNYIPIYDNGKLTFHYYTLKTQTAANWTNTQSWLQARTDIGAGFTSPNPWYLMTPRYWVEDARGWYLAAATGRPTADYAWLGGIADSGSTNWYYPANTDGYSTATIYSTGQVAQNGLYAIWINQDLAASAGDRAMAYWCNSCSMTPGAITGSFGWDDTYRTSSTSSTYVAETYSAAPIAMATTATAAQTVRTVTPPSAPTGLTASATSKTAVTLNWTAATAGTDSITDYSVQYSTDNSTWTTWAHTASTSTSAAITGLTAGTAYWFRVAAVAGGLTGTYSSAVGQSMADVGVNTALSGYSIPTTTTGTIRVLVFSSNPAGKLWFKTTSNIDGGIRGTANYDGDAAYTPINGYLAGTLASAGRMIGLRDTSATDINAALASLQYSSATASTDTITMWVSNGTEYVPIVNGSNVEFHYYGYTSTGATWSGAYGASGNGTQGTAGASRTIDGVTLPTGTSFLATARYRAEDLYIKSLGATTGWLAASDTAVEGTWKWFGPDTGGATGVQFWSGLYTGSSVGGEYQDWNASSATALGEPNGGTGESCLGYNSGSTYNTAPTSGYAWNDFSCSTSLGYYWEAYTTGSPYGSNTSNIAAVNYSAPSTSRTITVSAPATAPANLSGTSSTSGQVDLSWSAVSGATSYSVQYSTDGSSWTENRLAASTTTTESISGLSSGTYYQFRVAAIVSGNTGYYSTTYVTPNGAGRADTVTGVATAVSGLTLDSALDSRYVRVLLRTTNASASLNVTSYANLTGIRGTANYTTTAGAAALGTAGQMIGLVGTGTQVKAALATLKYTGPGSATTDTVSMWVSAGTTSQPPREYVPVVNASGQVEFHYFGQTVSTQTWQGAMNAASSDGTTINGVNPSGKFLATLDTADQHLLAASTITSGNTPWVAAGDYTAVNSQNPDKSWYWMGPDTGTKQFYQGDYSTGAAGAVNSAYLAWGSSTATTQQEPNGGLTESCMNLNASPYSLTLAGIVAASTTGGYNWNDLSCTGTTGSYLWEYVSNAPIGSATLGDNYVGDAALAINVKNAAEAISDLTATAASTSAVALTWTAPTVNAATPITGYTIEYSSNGGTNWTTLTRTESATSTFEVATGLSANTSYLFRIKATGSNWTGQVSATTSVTTRSSATTINIVSTGAGTLGTDYVTTGGLIAPKSGVTVNVSETDVEAALGANAKVTVLADTVNVNAPIDWSTNATLRLGLSSASRVAINKDVTGSGATAALNILPAACAYSSAGTYSGCYSIDVKSGANITLSGATPALTIGGQNYDVINTINGASTTNATGNIVAGLTTYAQTPANYSHKWALTASLDLSGTTYASSIFTGTYFTGTADGLGNTLNNYINATGASSNWEIGLFYVLSNATIRNLGLTNAKFTLNNYTASTPTYQVAGVLGGYITGTNTIDQVWTSGSMTTATTSATTPRAMGGLLGWFVGGSTTITRSWSGVSIDASGLSAPSQQMIGGLVGGTPSTFSGDGSSNNVGATLTINEAYTTGSIKYTKTGWRGIGGIVGIHYNSAAMTLSDVASWGNILSDTNSAGIVGVNNPSGLTINRGYTSSAACVRDIAASGTCTTGVVPGATLSGTTATAWGSTSGTSLVNLAPAAISLYAIPTMRTGNALFADGSFGAVGTKLVDGVGNDYTATLGTTGYPTVSGTPSWDTINAASAVGTYNVKYTGGLTLSGTAASYWSINPAVNTTSIQLTYATVASPPTAVTVTGGGQTTATVSWTAPATLGSGGVVGTRLWYSTNADMSGASVVYFDGSRPWGQLTGLTANTTYYVRVQAVGSAWVSDLSATASGTTRASGVTTLLTVVATGGGVAGTNYVVNGSAVTPIGTSASINATDLQTLLEAGDVVLSAETVTLSAPVTWAANTQLVLGNLLSSTVAINADLTATGTSAGLVIASQAANYSILTKAGVNVVLSGASSTFRVGNNPYTLLRTEADIRATTSANAGYWYAVANPITLTNSYTASPFNFTYQGRFDGLGNVISNMSMTIGSAGEYGLFSALNGATIRDLGVTNVSIGSSAAANMRVGALAGNGASTAGSTSTLSQVWVTGFLKLTGTTGCAEAGGIIGGASAGTLSISRAWTSVAVSTATNCVGSGGIIGTNVGSYAGGASTGATLTISESYSTGNVRRDMSSALWYGNGGIIGVAYGASTTITNVFAWGNINSYGTSAGISTAGISGVGSATITNAYTTASTCGGSPSNCLVNQIPGQAVTGGTGFTTGLWTSVNGTSLVNLTAPTKMLYVQVVAPTDGSVGTLSYQIVDSTGAVQTLSSLGLNMAGTPMYTVDGTTPKGTYNVSYVSDLFLLGVNSSVYSLSAWMTPTSVTISKYNQTLTWEPTTSIAFGGGSATPSAAPSSTISTTFSYLVDSAGTTGCTVNASTGVLTYTAAGTCVVKVTAAASGDYLSTFALVSFVIGAPTTSITIVSSGGGVAGTDYTLAAGRLYGTAGANVQVNADDLATALAAGSVTLAAQTVNVNAPVSWSANTTLTLGLSTASNVNINANLSATGASAGLELLSANYALATSSGAAIALSGASSTLKIGGNSYTLIRSAADFANVTATSGTYWALAKPIAFSGTRTSSPVNLTFTGTFDGLGNVVSNLAFAGTPTDVWLALFKTSNGGTFRNVGVIGLSNTVNSASSGSQYGFGALLGGAQTGTTTMTQVWSTGVIKPTGSTTFDGVAAGGLVGLSNNGGTLNISKSWSSVSVNLTGVTTNYLGVGGVVGGDFNAFNQSPSAAGGSISLSEVYGTGPISTGYASWWGVGGLIGLHWSTATMNVSDSFSWSSVSSPSTQWGGIFGQQGGGSTTITRSYTSRPYCWYTVTVATGCTVNVTPGTASGVTGTAWTTTNGSSLVSLPAPTIPLFVKPKFSGTTSSTLDLGYDIVDGSGAASSPSNVTVSGTVAYTPASLPVSATPYNVFYDSGLALSGTSAALYSLSPWPAALSVTISRNVTTLSWSPTTAFTRLDTGVTLAAPTTNSNATPAYSIASAGGTGCSITSARVLTFSAAGTCQVKVEYAQVTSYTAASQTVSIVISNAAPLAPTALNVTGGSADGALSVGWTAPSTATTGGTISSYTVEYSTDGTTWSSLTGVTGTSTTLTGLTNGTGYTVRVKALNATDSLVGAWATAGSAVAPYWLPTNTVAPSITGSAVGGLTLTAVDGTWSANGKTITGTTYQWQRSTDGSAWSNIASATSSSYTVDTVNDTGKVLRVVVSKTNGSNSSAYVSANAAATATVLSGLADAATLTSVTRGNTQIVVNWTAPTGLNGGTISAYKVQYRAGTTGTWTTASSSVSASATSYTITGLTNGTGYTVQVVPVTAAGDGTASATLSTTTPATAPSNSALPTISGTVAAGVTLTAVNGTWSGNGDTITGYSYQWQSATSAGGSYADLPGATAQTYTPTSSDVGQYLKVVVTATNAVASTSATSAATAAVQSGLATAPTGLTPVAGNGQITLTWTAPSALNGGTISTYNVYTRESGGSSWTLVTRTASATASQIITGLTNGTAYDLKVEAVTGAGAGTAATFSATTASTPYTTPLNTAAPTVSGVAATALTLTSTDGSWTTYGHTATTSYQWQSSADGSTGWTDISGATGPSYTVQSAVVGSYLRLKVIVDNGATPVGIATSAATAVVQTGLAAAPTITSVSRGDRQLEVNWTAPTTLNGGTISAYKVQTSTDGTTWLTASSTISSTATSTTITGLSNGTPYHVRLTAITLAGDGAYATSASTTTPSTTATNTVAPAITGIAAVARTLTATTGTWTDGGATVSTSVQWQSASTATGTYTDISGATSSTYTAVSADAGRYLRVVVTATNAAGSVSVTSSATSMVASGRADAPTALAAHLVPTPNLHLAVTWTAPTGLNGAAAITGYAVEYRVSGDTTWTVASASVAANASSYDIANGLTAGVSYDIRVSALTAAGTGAYVETTNPVLFGGAPANTVAPVVNGYRGVGEPVSVTTGTWNDFGVAISGFTYQWQVSSDGTTGWTDLATNATYDSYTPSSAESGKYLRVMVEATNIVGSTDVFIDAGQIGSAIADAPQSFTVTDGNRQLVLGWTAPASVNGGLLRGYIVEISDTTAGTGWTQVGGTLADTATALTVTGLTNTHSYSVRVRAVTTLDGANATVTGAIPYTLPSNTALPTVTGAIAEGETIGSTDGTWSANGRPITSTTYQWQVSADAGSTWVAAAGTNGSPTYTVHGSDVGKALRLKVSRTNAAGTTVAYSASTTVQSGYAEAPTGLVITRADGQLGLAWTAPENTNGGVISNYIVQVRQQGASTWTTVSRTASTVPAQTVSGLTNALTYELRVFTVTGVTGAASEVVTGIPAGSPIETAAMSPSFDTIAVGYPIRITPATFDPNDSVAVTNTYVWQASTDGTSWATIAGATGTEFTPTSAEIGATIRVVQTATNSLTSTTSTAVVSPTAVGSALPAAPANVTATVGAASGEITVAWTAVTGADLRGALRGAYRIQISTDGQTWSAAQLSASPNDTSFTVTGLANGTPYSVRVAAASTLDVVGAYAQASGTVVPYAAPINTAAPVVTGAEARGYSLTSGAGSWNANGRSISATTYQWQSSLDGSTWIDIPGATASTYTLTAAEAGTFVRSAVSTTNLAGTTTAYSLATGVIGTAAAAAPTDVTVTEGDRELTVHWTAPTQLSGGTIVDYEVRTSTDSNTWTTVTRTASTETSQTITGLVNGTDYWVSVAAITTITGAPAVTGSTFTPYAAPINTVLPEITGSVRIGDTVTASTGTWSGNGRVITATSFQWQVSADGGAHWSDLVGETGATYVPSGVLGNLLRVLVTNSNIGGSTVAASLATNAVEIGTPGAPTAVTVSPGDLTLTASWTAPTWLADGSVQDYTVEINDGSGWTAVSRTASATTSQVVSGLTLGTDYQVRVRTETGRSSAWSTPVTFTAIGKPSEIAAPSISGEPLAGQSLTSTLGDWAANGAPVTTAIQWEQSTDGGQHWTNVPFATTGSLSAVAGRSYRTVVTATNAGGTTVSVSDPTAYVVSVRPSTVRNLVVSELDTALGLTWDAPNTLGGGTITNYIVEYSTDGDNWAVVNRTPSSTTGQTITGLTNGTDYYVQVRAVTSVIGSPAIAPTAFRPYGAPISQGSLALVSGTVRYGETLYASTGSWDFNGTTSAGFSYQWQVSTDAGISWTDISGATASSFQLSGYVGTLIRVRVTATNAHAQSTTVNSTATVAVAHANPTPPRSLVVVPGDRHISLSWSAPTNLGGTDLRGYVVQINTGGNSWTTVGRASALATSETITGLTNGVDYQVRVRAETVGSNATIGSSSWLNASSMVTPYGLPINTVQPALSGTARYDAVMSASSGSWDENGASVIVSYQWQANTGSGWSNIAGATAAQYTVGNLVGGVVRAVVTATNQAGATVVSTTASSTVVSAPAGAVTGLSVLPADQSLLLSWTAPAYLGGAPITDYIVEYSTDGSSWQSSARTPSATPSHTIVGLTNGTGYQVRIRALNGATGVAAIDATGVVPRGLPISTAAPAMTMHPNSPAAPQVGRQMSVNTGEWSGNGVEVTGVAYQWQVGDGSSWSNVDGATAATYTPTGNVGSRFRVLVTATNVAGSTTAASAATAVTIPAAASAPRALTAAEADRAVTLSWQLPVSTGGAPVANYDVQISTDGDTWTPVDRTPSATPAQTITGLTNGVSYTVRVRALNGVNGSWVFLSDVTPRGLPILQSAPTIAGTAQYLAVLTANPGDWDANGADIEQTNYQWQSSRDGRSWTNIPAATSQSYTVGLYVGSTLRVLVTRTNEAGATTEASAATRVVDAIPAATPVITSQLVGNAQVTLGWTPPVHSGGVEIAAYTLQYSTDQLSWTTILTAPTVTSSTITGLANGRPIWARVRAETDRSGDWSPTAGPFTPVAPPVAPTPTPTVNPTVQSLLTQVMPVLVATSSLTSLTGPSEVSVTSDGRIELQPTQSIALKNGQPVAAQVNVTDTGVTVTTDTVNLAVAYEQSILESGLVQGMNATVSGAGFAPGMPVVTWIQSTPTKLSTVTADSAGSVTAGFAIPAGIEPGAHTIQINSVDAKGDVVSVMYGVEVKPAPGSMQPMASALSAPNALGTAWMWWLAFALLFALLLAVGVYVARRARRS